MLTEHHLYPRSKLHGTWQAPGKGPADNLEERFGYALKHAPAYAERKEGVRLRELRVTEVEDGWRAMLKGDRRGKPVVAYFYAPAFSDVLVQCLTSLDSHYCSWHHDEYPPRRYVSPTTTLRF